MASATCATVSRICSSVPPGLARLLVLVARRRAVGLEQRLDVAEQHGLALVVGVELAREGDLVEAQAGVARGALERAQRVLAALVLGDRERDALLGRIRQRAVAELRAEARVGAQHGGRSGEHADEVRELAPARQRALQDRNASLGRRQLVVDLEPALLGLHPASLSACDLRPVSIRHKGMQSRPIWRVRARRRGVERALRAAARLRVRGAGGDCHQQQAEQEGPEGDPVGLGQLRAEHRAGAAASGRHGAGVGCPVMVMVRRSARRALGRNVPASVSASAARSAAGCSATTARPHAGRDPAAAAPARSRRRPAPPRPRRRWSVRSDRGRRGDRRPRPCAPTGGGRLPCSSRCHPPAERGHRLNASALSLLACGVS